MSELARDHEPAPRDHGARTDDGPGGVRRPGALGAVDLAGPAGAGPTRPRWWSRRAVVAGVAGVGVTAAAGALVLRDRLDGAGTDGSAVARVGPPTHRRAAAGSPTGTRATPCRVAAASPRSRRPPPPSLFPTAGEAAAGDRGHRADDPRHQRPRGPPAPPGDVRTDARPGRRGPRRRHRRAGSPPSSTRWPCPTPWATSPGVRSRSPAPIRPPCGPGSSGGSGTPPPRSARPRSLGRCGRAGSSTRSWSTSGPTTSTCPRRAPAAGTSAARTSATSSGPTPSAASPTCCWRPAAIRRCCAT